MHDDSQVFLPIKTISFIPCLSSHLYTIFEQSSLYSCLIFSIYILAIYIGILTTYSEYRNRYEPILYSIELILFVYCTIEFLTRIYASESKVRYRGLKGKRRFFIEHYLIIDLFILISYALIFLLNFFQFYLSTVSCLHILRFLQLLRFISLDRHIKSIPLISSILWQYRRVIFATIYLTFLVLLLTAYFLWIIESDIETKNRLFFRTYTDSLWFTINSMATIGYGDTWPVTLTGRFLTATLCCSGVILWMLPAGIISSGLISIEKQRRESERLRRPAARLILAWWRLQSTNMKTNQCKQFIARLLYCRIRRQFQYCRYTVHDGFDVHMRKDIDRILHYLHSIDERLSV